MSTQGAAGGSTHRAPPDPWPFSPRTWPRPSRCVWRSASPVSPCTCSPAQLQAQFSFRFNPQINMCSYIFNREAVLLEWGLVLHLSPHCLEGILHSRGRQAGAGPGTQPSQRNGEQHHPWAISSAWGWGPAVSHLPLPQATCTSPLSIPIGGPSPRKLPGVLPDPLSTFPQLRSQENKGQLPVRGQRVEVTLSLAFQK